MSLFKISDLIAADAPAADTGKKPEAFSFETDGRFCSAEILATLKGTIGDITPDQSVYFKTDGAWSNYDLLEYLLQITGPARVAFTTWAINEVAISRFLTWQAVGRITELQCVIDVGLRNRKPEIYQQAAAAFTRLKMGHCHAKVTTLISDTHHITFLGSSNYTHNPRKEVGVIIWNQSVAEFYYSWIKSELDGGTK